MPTPIPHPTPFCQPPHVHTLPQWRGVTHRSASRPCRCRRAVRKGFSPHPGGHLWDVVGRRDGPWSAMLLPTNGRYGSSTNIIKYIYIYIHKYKGLPITSNTPHKLGRLVTSNDKYKNGWHDQGSSKNWSAFVAPPGIPTADLRSAPALCCCIQSSARSIMQICMKLSCFRRTHSILHQHKGWSERMGTSNLYLGKTGGVHQSGNVTTLCNSLTCDSEWPLGTMASKTCGCPLHYC